MNKATIRQIMNAAFLVDACPGTTAMMLLQLFTTEVIQEDLLSLKGQQEFAEEKKFYDSVIFVAEEAIAES